MKNFESFKEELEKLDSGTRSELRELTDNLCLVAAQNARSDQNQHWAWTRFESHLLAPKKESLHFGWIRMMGWATVAAFAFWVGFSIQTQMPPTVLATASDICAVPFHSKEAAADVIWVNGYDYLAADGLTH